MTGNTNLTAALFYTEQDANFRAHFSAYFTLLIKEGYLDEISYHLVETLNRKQQTQLETGRDLYFFVVSTDLIASDFCNGSTFRKIRTDHFLDQVQMVPIIYRKSALYDTFFPKIEAVPGNGKPIVDTHWASLDEALHVVFGEIRTLCFAWRKKKNNFERDWDRVRNQKSVEEFRRFVQQYPHSRYEALAQKAIQDLSEEQLWNQAQRLDSIDGYYTYLDQSPLNQHRFEAAARIRSMENDEDRNWKEVTGKDHLVMYMDYYLRNPYGKYTQQAKKIIDERLGKPLRTTKGWDFKTQQNALDLTAMERLKPSEVFAMNTQVNYSQRAVDRLLRLLKTRQSNQFFHAVFLFFIGLVELYLFDRWYEPVIDEYGAVDLPNTRILQLVLIIVVNLWLLFRAYLYFGHLQRDIRFLQRAYYVMQSLTVLLKTSFISRDHHSIETIIKFFTRIDRRTGEIEKKTVLSYLLQKDRVEQEIMLPVEQGAG